MITQAQDTYWEGYLQGVRDAQEILNQIGPTSPQPLRLSERRVITSCCKVISGLAQVPYDHGWEPEWSRTLGGVPN